MKGSRGVSWSEMVHYRVLAVLLLALLCSLVMVLLHPLLLSSAPGRHKPPEAEIGPPPRYHHGNRYKQVVLVTGAAGFIGFHVSNALATQWRATVVGVDSYTESYDVQLKWDRTNELIKAGVHMYRGDVCDQTLLSFLFEKFNFTSVVHLAAQAGVRYSLEHPLHFIHSNIECYITLLNLIKAHKHISLVYASSSSVYGHNSPLPFSSSLSPHIPSNIYAATKHSNELFAKAFCLQHDLRAVGLRFFTVYGPWGRPDMAVYKFAQNMLNGRPLVMYNSSQPLVRDLTFISDAVKGILLALEYKPSQCGEVYNIGSGQMVNIYALLRLLETELNTTASLAKKLPLPPCDLPATLADISKSQRVLGYKPQVSIQQGIREFVHWLKVYLPLREMRMKKGINELERMLMLEEREVAEMKRKKLDLINSDFLKRLHVLRNKYKEFAQEIKRELPRDLGMKKFVYYPGVDSRGSTIIKGPHYQGNKTLLKKRCQMTEQCIAFTSKGEFKNHINPPKKWIKKSKSEGLYVGDIDMCATDLHNCGKHQDCIFTGPSSYNCTCHKSFVKLASGCVEKYKEGVFSEAENNFRFSNYFDGLDWGKYTQGKNFVFFQGVDSPGGDYLVVKGGADSVEKLKKICSKLDNCLAFNTNGILKHSLKPPEKWIRWTKDPKRGMYVLDVDYCSLDGEQCPSHSSCFHHSPGNYSCKCVPPWTMSTGLEYSCEIEGENINSKDIRKNAMTTVESEVMEVESDLSTTKEAVIVTEMDGGMDHNIHVIVSCDQNHLPGLVSVLHSVIRNTRSVKNLHLHLVLSGLTREEFTHYLQCYPPLPVHSPLDVVQLDPRLLKGRIHVYSSPEEVGNLSSLANFGRFFFHELFPQLERALYLDADVIVKGDIAELWRQFCASDQLLFAAPRTRPTYGDFFSPKVRKIFKERYGRHFSTGDQTFNSGVYGVNLALWRKKRIHDEVFYWLDQQGQEPLWKFGTQPIMLLVGYKQWTEMDQRWNVNGLGWDESIPKETLASAKLLHWNGKRKPWLKEGLYREIWSQHAPIQCTGHGTCVLIKEGQPRYTCQCERNYSGNQCQIHLS